MDPDSIRTERFKYIRRFGDQFVFATDLKGALARAAQRPDARVLYSFDMLGEGARTRADADRACESYVNALAALRRGIQNELGERLKGLFGK